MINCAVLSLPYSRHMLTYENEAVFLLIHISTVTTRQEQTSLLYCWDSAAGVTSHQMNGSRLGTPHLPLLHLLAPGRPSAIRLGEKRGVRRESQRGIMLLTAHGNVRLNNCSLAVRKET